jgi:hypothetical protein
MVRPIMGPVPRTAISESATPGKANNIRCAKAPPAGVDIDQACPGPARPKGWRRAGERSCRVDREVGLRSLAFPPSVLQGCGCRWHRSPIVAVSAAGWCPGGTAHSMAERLARMACPARVPPWTTPGVPRVRGTAPAWSGSKRGPRPGGAQRPRPPSGGPSAAGGAQSGAGRAGVAGPGDGGRWDAPLRGRPTCGSG